MHQPDKKWLVDVIATLDPDNAIFKKDYVAPPIRKRLQDLETIVLPNELFEGLPPHTSKVKARRMKIMSEAFAAEKVARNREMAKRLYEDMVGHEVRRDKFKEKMVPRKKLFVRDEEEEKGGTAGRTLRDQA
jgi:hypothetical protein